LILAAGKGLARIALEAAAECGPHFGRAQRKAIGGVLRQGEAELDDVAFARGGEIANGLREVQRGGPRRTGAGAADGEQRDRAAGELRQMPKPR
jgi:hypothetical protein